MQTIRLLVLLQLYTKVIENREWEPRISLPGQCGANEYYNECGTSCKIDCYSLQVGTRCKDHGCRLGCFCKVGLFRNGKGGPCVKPDKCFKIRGHDNPKKRNETIAEINKLIEDIGKIRSKGSLYTYTDYQLKVEEDKLLAMLKRIHIEISGDC